MTGARKNLCSCCVSVVHVYFSSLPCTCYSGPDLGVMETWRLAIGAACEPEYKQTWWMRIVLAKKWNNTCGAHTHSHVWKCPKMLKNKNASKWSLVPPRDRDRQIFPIASPRGLTHKFTKLNAATPHQSSAQTISCPELLTVSLAGGPQSYSTQRDFSIKRAHRGIDLAQGGGQTWPREGHAKHLQNKQTTGVTTNRRRGILGLKWCVKKKRGVPWCGRVTRSVAGGWNLIQQV